MKSKKKRSSAKVKGVNLHKTPSEASGYNSTTKYGFDPTVVVSTKPIFRYISDINSKVNKLKIQTNLKEIISRFLNSISQKISTKSLSAIKLKEAKARIIIYLNEFVKYLTKKDEFKTAHLEAILSITRALVRKHNLKKTMDVLLIIINGMKLNDSNSNMNASNAYNSNNSSNW